MADTFEALSQRTDAEAFEPGEPIYRESEPGSVVFLLVEGEVVLERAGQPEERVTAGELFGESALFGENRRQDTARAVTSARVVPIGPALYANLAARDSRFAWSVRTSRSRRLKRIGALALLALFLGVAVLRAQVSDVGNQLLVPAAPTDGMRFGQVLAVGDFNGDGIDDLAVTAKSDDNGELSFAGRVEVYLGTPAGLSNSAVFTRFGFQEGQEIGDALAAGDFNGDGRDELAIGTASTNLSGPPVVMGAGFVEVWGMDAAGVWHWLSQWSQDSPGILGVAEYHDYFGSALAVGDFDADEFDDLAIGSWAEDIGDVMDAGAVNVIYGSATGLASTGNQIWYRNGGGISGAVGGAQNLGYALAAGDFDGDGPDDLAIGIPGDVFPGTALLDGSVVTLFGAVGSGLQSGEQARLDRQILGEWVPADPLLGSHFGAALAAGVFNPTVGCVGGGNCLDDLAVAAPEATVNGAQYAGLVFALFGVAAHGLDSESAIAISQSVYAGGGDSAPEAYDGLGFALAVGPLGGSGRAGLAMGSPTEFLGDIDYAGSADLVRDLAPDFDPVANPSAQWIFAAPGLECAPAAAYTKLGTAVALGDFNGDGYGDFAVGLPGKVQSPQMPFFKPGAVQILYGALFADGFESGGLASWSNF